MRRRGIAATAVAVGFGLWSARAAAGPLGVEEALTRARQENAQLRAAAADLEAARGRLRQARLIQSNPVVSADLARHTAPGSDAKDRGVELDQEIEIGGQRGLRISAATHDVTRAEYLLADRRRTVEGEVRRAFFGVLAAERRRALAAERLALAERLTEATRRRSRAGEVATLDARLAELESVRAEQERIAAETARVRAATRLADAIGAPADEPLAVAAETELPPAPDGDEDLIARALAARPDLAAARAERARLETQASLVRRQGRVPNPTLKGWYREEQIEEHIVGGGISVPLPLFNLQQGAEAELLAQAAGAAAETKRLSGAIPREVQVALARRAGARDAWQRYQRDALPAAEAVRKLLERGFGAGYLALPEVLVQQDRLLQTRAAGIDAWLDLHEAEADVIEATGGGP
jgi:cobalt-zinc-cadmium efflux system outer membrane protein